MQGIRVGGKDHYSRGTKETEGKGFILRLLSFISSLSVIHLLGTLLS